MKLLILIIIYLSSGLLANPLSAPMCRKPNGSAPTERCPLFQKQRLELGNQTLTVEIAKSEEEISRGLGGRDRLADGKGMLFIYDDEDFRNFWMKNAFMHLSIGFFDAQKILVDMQDMEADDPRKERRLPMYSSRRPAQFALEVPLGWFVKNRIKIGDKFKILSD
jgi:uncharacterized membrane protein (UPF0127 family)